MNSERKYIFVLAAVALVYIVIELTTPEKINWDISLHKSDKNPYGSYLIHERLPDLFNEVNHSYLTVYELADTVDGSLFILSQQFDPSKEDVKALLNYVQEGNNAVIAASYFNKANFLDTLKLSSDYFLIDEVILEGKTLADTVTAQFAVNNHQEPSNYPFSGNALKTYFVTDSSHNTLATIDNNPIFIEVKHGSGSLYLCSLPLAFTNNYLLHEENNSFVSNVLSYLPANRLYWTEYYQTGRLEAQSPLRYILSNESLAIAYYTAVLALLLFIFFEIKRKQRMIPVIAPLTNSSLEFVHTLGNLYYRNANHKVIAEKRILFFIEQLRSNYYFNSMDWSEQFMQEVAQKTGNDLITTRFLFEQISALRNSESITETQLIELNKKLDNFKITE